MKKAQVQYYHGYYKIRRPGHYVRCAITNSTIPLRNLMYWNVEKQEGYRDYIIARRAFYIYNETQDIKNRT